MEHLNVQLFLAINAGAHPPWGVLSMARFLADWLVPGAIILFMALWVRKPTNERGALLTATLMMLLGLGVNQALGALYFHPRPFVIGLGHQYLPHAPDNSFPSDHATFLWTLGFTLLLSGALRGWGAVLALAGVSVAWARIYLGIHFPMDMLGSLIISMCMAGLGLALSGVLSRRVLPLCNALYGRLVFTLRLPSSIFPH